jgi:diguanylate cyclase (GGDEF)-like protein/PAS domain S-box-containing protein
VSAARGDGTQTADPSDVFDLVRMGLVISSLEDGRVRRANDAACELVGRDRADYVGRHWSEFVDPAQVAELAVDLDQGRVPPARMVVRVLRPDGSSVDVVGTGTEIILDGERCLLTQFEDVTELVSAHMQLRLVLDHTPVSIFLMDHEGRVLLTGGSDSQAPAAALRRAARSTMFREFHDQPDVLTMVRAALRGERVQQVVIHDGHWYDVQLVPVPGVGGGPLSVAGIVSDVSARERATADLVLRTARQSALADLAQQALEATDERALWDAGVETLTCQLDASQVTVRPDTEEGGIPSPLPSPQVCGRQEPVTRIPMGHKGRPLATITVRRPGRPLTSDDLEFIRSVAAVLGAASLRIRMENAVRYRSLHDPLTGLPNRDALLDRLRRSLRRAGRGRWRLGVLFIDLDGFKAVNDTLGHQAGDDLLRAVAARLSEAVRPGDVVARLAGDEFAVLCERIATPGELRRIGERVIASALTAPIELGRPVSVSGSVGLALSGQDLTDSEELLNAAYMAMYEAKRAGPGQLAAYDDKIRAAMTSRLRDTTDLRCALRAGDLMLRFEPVVARSGAIVAAEAVPWWTHPTRGLVGPNQLYPIAVEAGLTVEVDRWLVDEVSTVALTGPAPRPDREDKGRQGEVWIRISERTLSDDALRRQIISRASRASQAGHGKNVALCVLVPDTVAVRGDEVLETVVDELAKAGIAARVDFTDFGPLRMASRRVLPAGLRGIRLGVRSVRGVEQDGVTGAILAGITRFTHLLDLDATVRDVDTSAELDALRALGCDLAQGAAVGPPLPTAPW